MMEGSPPQHNFQIINIPAAGKDPEGCQRARQREGFGTAKVTKQLSVCFTIYLPISS